MKKVFLFLLIFSFSVLIAQNEKQTSGSLFDIQAANVISVTVGGEFVVNGTFPASRIERVDQFVTRLYNEGRRAAISSALDSKSARIIKKQIDAFATRNILLKRKDGSELKLNLAKFRLTGDFNHNPYLKDGDVLVFPVTDIDKYFVEISGAINKPGKFNFYKGDKLSDVIFLARGISDVYSNLAGIKITRFGTRSEKEEVINLSINEDIELQNKDFIEIIADYETEVGKVLILGEVIKPGYYPITKNTTRISDLINKAGGTTNIASLRRSELIRNKNVIDLLRKADLYDEDALNVNNFQGFNQQNPSIKNHKIQLDKFEKMNYLLASRMANITTDDVDNYELDNTIRILHSRSNIDFENLDDTKNNILLRDGDIILIPEISDDIYIYGQVGKAGYYSFEENKSVMEYIQNAGGLGEDAQDEDEIVVIKSKTYEWQTLGENASVNIAPGDMIWVPKDPPRTVAYYINSLGSVLGTLATIALVVIQLVK